MTLERARELLLVQTDLCGGRNRNAASVILMEANQSLGQSAVDQLIRELGIKE